MKPRNVRAIVLAAVLCGVDASAVTEDNISRLCPLVSEDVSEGSREWQRHLVCKTYPDMEEELGIDGNARQQIIDALADRNHTRVRSLSSEDTDKWVRAEAENLTRMLSRVHAAIGDELMERFYTYMHSGRERLQLEAVKQKLPPDAALSAEQRSRLMSLFSQHKSKLDARVRPALWEPNNRCELPSDEQQLIQGVNSVADWQLGLLKTMELDAQLETEAAKFLTPAQLETLKGVNSRSARSTARYIRREWMRIDHSKLPDLQRRIAALPRQWTPLPASGDIEIEYAITIDDRKPITGSRSLANGASLTIEADELLIEIKPTVYKRNSTIDIGFSRRPSTVDIGFFATIGGERRRLEQPTSAGSNKQSLSIVEGVRKGYFVTTSVEVSD
jgi:hypothetical protein